MDPDGIFCHLLSGLPQHGINATMVGLARTRSSRQYVECTVLRHLFLVQRGPHRMQTLSVRTTERGEGERGRRHLSDRHALERPHVGPEERVRLDLASERGRRHQQRQRYAPALPTQVSCPGGAARPPAPAVSLCCWSGGGGGGASPLIASAKQGSATDNGRASEASAFRRRELFPGADAAFGQVSCRSPR